MTSDKRFILWNGPEHPPRSNEGEYLTGGALGEITLDNVYLTTYGARPDGSKNYNELEIGECVRGVVFRLSGERGEYDIYRVR